MKRFIIIFLLLVSLIYVLPVQAQEKINEFQSKINVNKDGTVDVSETYRYDFGSENKHGIIVKTPYVKTNEDGKKFQMDMMVQRVTDETGEPYKYETSKEDGKLITKIGDANSFVTGEKVYILTYKVRGALTYFSDHDELSWNAYGHESQVLLEKASAEITLPEGVQKDQIKTVCYTGSLGMKNQDCLSESVDHGARFSTTQVLFPSEGFTVAVSFPKGIVAVLEPREVVPFFETPLGKLVLLGLMILAFLWYIVYPLWLPIKWYLYGRDPLTGTGAVRAWFEPPKNKQGRVLTPEEVGTLVDEHIAMRDISSMVVGLAQRGYFKILEKTKNDFYFQKTREFDTDLLTYEREFLDSVFKSKDEIHLKDLKLYETVETTKKKIYEHMVKEGYFPENPQKVRTFYEVMGGLAMFTFNLPLVLSTFIFGRSMSKKTMFGVESMHVANSLRNFLTSQERQLEFQAKNQMMFEKLLPYAVAFGVEKIWADRFKDLSLKEPDWYQGYYGGQFNSTAFTKSLNSSFSQVNTAATPTRSSSGFSSGFSGGGFSGGGGGGSSAGSW